MMRLRRTGVAVLAFGALAACPRGDGGRGPRPAGVAWGLGADGLGAVALRGVAPAGADEQLVTSGASVRRIARGGEVRWHVALDGAAGAVAVDGEVAAGAVAVDGEVAAIAVSGPAGSVIPGVPDGLRGDPGAAIVGVGAGDGEVRWTVGAGSSRWTVVRTVAAAGDGFLISGSFAGTLRVGDRTVTSAGNADGFVASIDHAGAVRWLRRMGGDGPDSVAGVAALGAGRTAIAGTFSFTAELGDTTLSTTTKGSLVPDGFVAVVEADGRVAWARTWGGAEEDTCAGVAVLDGGVIAVAGTVRGEVEIAGRQLESRGPADGMVAVFAADASVKGAWLIGGDDFDGVSAIGSLGTEVVVAGWFTGQLAGPRGARTSAVGVDDVFVATGDASGATATWHVSSPGPASVSALAATRGAWRLAVHAAEPVALDGDTRAAGAALWFRGF